jgi:hypothetical protein
LPTPEREGGDAAALKKVRMAFIAAIAVALAGYAQAPRLTAGAEPMPHTAAYTLDTSIEDIAASPRGAAVLNRDIPGLLQNASYPMFKAMSLRLVGRLSGGRLTDDMLARTQSDLAALPAPATPLRTVSRTVAEPEFN